MPPDVFHPYRPAIPPPGFTIVELLVSMAVLGMMAALMLAVVDSAQKNAKQMSSRAEQYREARRAFERITQRLGKATLNTYWDYVDSFGDPRTTANAATFDPRRYFRVSELRYIQANATILTDPRGGTPRGQAVFFQAPLGLSGNASLSGLNTLLNTTGYFLASGGDAALRPPTITAIKGPQEKIRHRLFEMTEPSGNLTVYRYTSGNASYSGNAWFTTPLAEVANTSRLADNIVALLFRAEYTTANGSATNSFHYSSAPSGGSSQDIKENNLPPTVRVTMVAVDEVSAARIQETGLALEDARDDAGLKRLEEQLIASRLNYRKFESSVRIGPSKWSTR